LIAKRMSPNAISVIGMIAGVLAGAAFAATSWWPSYARLLFGLGAICVQVRLLCNLFDGMVAIGSGRASPVGELYNEVPDRVSDAATLIGFGYALGGEPWLGFGAALLAVFTAYIRAMGKAAGTGNDFCGPMAKPVRMFLVTIAAVYVACAPTDFAPSINGWQLPAIVLAVVAIGCVVTSWRRLRRIAGHLHGTSHG
tara:strand:+ start:655 stop:1245 length:591 start_codon:yes stop_codon:yes gene_type:complete